MSLKEYHRKRDFAKTKEPFGSEEVSRGSQYLFVVQKHAASHLHYDFRLQLDDVLKSWAVPKGPSLDPEVKHLAMHVEDHPLEYASFEGIIPKGGYGGGTVMVWDIGKWEPLDENPLQAYHKGDLNFILHGKKLSGRWKLIKMKRSQESGKEPWLLFKVKDKYSRSESTYDITKQEPDSAVSARTMQQIAAEKERVWTKEGEIKQPQKTKKPTLKLDLANISGAKKRAMPPTLSPQLTTLVTTPPKGDGWLHELKWDGYRLIAKIRQGEVSLLTRRNKDWTAQFPAIANSLKSAKFKDIILDGEVVALDEDNKANFQILQNSMQDRSSEAELRFYIFDLLYYDGYDLRDLPLIRRKELLAKIITNKSVPPDLKYNDHVIGNGEKVFANACSYKLEGIISKKVNSRYVHKRTRDWLKIKCIRRQEFVIGGYTDPKSSRQFFGALLLGYYDEAKKLNYCGRVGTGFTQVSLKEVAQVIKQYAQKNNPFDVFSERVTKDIHWVTPQLVAEIEYLEITSDGMLRHPSFKGLREDKNPKAIFLEKPQDVNKMESKKISKSIKKSKPRFTTQFTNLQRVLYPEQGVTKEDLKNYYELIADWILPHIKNRPLTLVRCPTGNHKNCFYQKHMNETMPQAIHSIDIPERDETKPYIYISDLDGLMGLVQMGVLEIHPWGSSNKNVDSPDRMIFDLDPAPDVSWDEVVECANLLHKFIDFLKLKSFVKTTGGKGLHIVVPIKPTLSWEEVHDITKRIAELMVEIHPQKYIAVMSKEKRKGKIFIDYVRNTRGATAIAAFSTRAKPEAPIAVPITWEELFSGIKSDTFNISNINERLKQLKNDPWQDFFKTRQSLTAKIKKTLGF